MDEKRKKIIINEILYWKQSRLLPEQYCDYLLALYSGGEESPWDLEQPGKPMRILPYLVLLLLPISAFFIYFTELPYGMQMGLPTLLMGIPLAMLCFNNKKSWVILPLAVLSLMVLMVSASIASRFLYDQPFLYFMVLFSNCAWWAAAGKIYSQVSFWLSGLGGALLLLVFIFI